MTCATPRLDLKLVFVLLCLGAITCSLPMPPGGMSKADGNEGSEVENNSPTSSQPSISGGNSPLPHNNPEEDESAPAGPNDSAVQAGSGDSNPSPPPPATDAPKPIPNEEEGEGNAGAGTTTASVGSTGKPAENSDEDEEEESDEDQGESDEDENEEESDEDASKEASEEKEQGGGGGGGNNNGDAEQGEQSDSDESFEYNSLDQLSDESDEDDDDDDDSNTYEDSDSYEDEERRSGKEKILPSLKSKIRQLGGNDIDSDFGDGFPTERDREPGSAGEFDPFGQDMRTSGKPETSTETESRTEAAEAMMP